MRHNLCPSLYRPSMLLNFSPAKCGRVLFGFFVCLVGFLYFYPSLRPPEGLGDFWDIHSAL